MWSAPTCYRKSLEPPGHLRRVADSFGSAICPDSLVTAFFDAIVDRGVLLSFGVGITQNSDWRHWMSATHVRKLWFAYEYLS